MKTKVFLTLGTSVIFSLLTGCASNSTAQTGQILTGVGQILSQQPQQPTNTPAPVQQPAVTTQSIGEAAAVTLVDIFMQQMGITQPQAQAGAGMLMQYAQTKMSPNAFSQLQALPGMPAPASNTSINNVLELNSAFQQQGLSPVLIPQMIPAMLQYVGNAGGQGAANSLNAALMGR